VSASEPGHLGVGQNDGDATKIIIQIITKRLCLKKRLVVFMIMLTFSLDGGALKYKLDNGGSTFSQFLQNVGGGTVGGDDACLSYNTGGLKTVALSPSESVVMGNPGRLTQTRGTAMNFSDGGFMGYYVGQSSYEIYQLQRTVWLCVL
jgi:hypothetical protein